MVTQDQLQALFSYNPINGDFTRLKVIGARGRGKAGDIAGGFGAKGYHRIEISGKKYQSHRLAWLYIYGVWPTEQIDHINGIKDDNRIANLREATNAENCRNRKVSIDSTSGKKGVCLVNRSKKWRAYCYFGGKQHSLGHHATADLASAAYEAYAKVAFGEFYYRQQKQEAQR